MKRLLDMPAGSPLLEQARRLIEAAPPVDDSTEQMLRVRRALDRPVARGAILRAPAFVLGGALVVFGASAFAAVRVWVEHHAPARESDATEQRSEVPAQPASPGPVATRAESPPPQPSAAEPPSARAPEATLAAAESARAQDQVTPPTRVKSASKASRDRRVRARARTRTRARGTESRQAARSDARIAAVAPAESVTSAPEVPQVASVETGPAPATSAPAPVRAEPVAERVSQPVAAKPDDARDDAPEPEVSAVAVEKRSSDSELVVRAVRALRRDHDPEAASRLLARYRSRNPSGVLAEEVLSLQIEAALAAKDARAASFAREYLSRYPGGRYQARAQRALSGRAP